MFSPLETQCSRILNTTLELYRHIQLVSHITATKGFMITNQITELSNRTHTNLSRNQDLRQEGIRSAIQELKRSGE
jgi:hypothetical protein